MQLGLLLFCRSALLLRGSTRGVSSCARNATGRAAVVSGILGGHIIDAEIIDVSIRNNGPRDNQCYCAVYKTVGMQSCFWLPKMLLGSAGLLLKYTSQCW